jgi:hypothetical protein
MDKPLTVKQERFTQGLFKGLSQRKAYKQVFDCKDMSDPVIDNKASILANKGEVRVRLKNLQDAVAETNMWDRKRSLDALIGLYEKAETNIDRTDESGVQYADSSLINAGIKAVETINKMLGINEPDRTNNKIEIILKGGGNFGD